MRGRRLGLAILGAALAMALPATGAGAATIVGDDCVADKIVVDRTIVQLTAGDPATQLTVPADGVITRLQISGPPAFPGTLAQWFKVLRPTGGINGFQVAEEDVLLVKGVSSFSYRLPVRAGDRLGLASGGQVFYCGDGIGNSVGSVKGNLPLGSTAAFGVTEGVAVPVLATIEPDADRDGYGDETQDACPQSALLREACLPVGLDAYAIQSKKSVVLYVAASPPGPATVTAAATAGKAKLPPATLVAEPGRFAQFRFRLPKAVTERLKKKGVSVPVRFSISATNVAGLPSAFGLTLKVR